MFRGIREKVRVPIITEIIKIINSTQINWGTIIAEAQQQIELGKVRAAFDLGCFLEDLKTEMKMVIPLEVLDKLFKIVTIQVKEKRKKLRQR